LILAFETLDKCDAPLNGAQGERKGSFEIGAPELARFPELDAARIWAALRDMEHDPFGGDARKLAEGSYRQRSGTIAFSRASSGHPLRASHGHRAPRQHHLPQTPGGSPQHIPERPPVGCEVWSPGFNQRGLPAA